MAIRSVPVARGESNSSCVGRGSSSFQNMPAELPHQNHRQNLLKMQALPHYQHCPLQAQNFSGRSGGMAGKTRPPAPVLGPLRHTALLASHDGPRRLSLQVWKCRAPMGGDTAWRLQGTPKSCSPHGTVGRLCLPAFRTLKPSCVCRCFHLNAPG